MWKKTTEQDRRRALDGMVDQVGRRFPDVETISPTDLRRRLSSEDIVLIDVRSPKERAVSTIPGATIPEAIEGRLEEISERTVVAYCTIGARSSAFARQMTEQTGIPVLNLEGSVLAWTHAGGPLEDAEGPTQRVHVFGPRWNLVADGYEGVW